MVFIRANLFVEGNVQGVGYRALVKQVARMRGVKGGVRNLDDGRVEINCEGKDKDSILDFIKAINVKSKRPDNIFAPNVEKIKTFWEGEEGFEGEEGYIKPDIEFNYFEIDYGKEAETPFEKANLEKLEIGSLMMINLGEEVNTGFSTTHSDFQDLDGKYDVVSQKLESINDNISNLGGDISKLVNRLDIIIEAFVKDKK